MTEKLRWWRGHGTLAEYIADVYPAYAAVGLLNWDNIYFWLNQGREEDAMDR